MLQRVIERALAVAFNLDHKSVVFEVPAHDLGDSGVVVHDEDPRCIE